MCVALPFMKRFYVYKKENKSFYVEQYVCSLNVVI